MSVIHGYKIVIRGHITMNKKLYARQNYSAKIPVFRILFQETVWVLYDIFGELQIIYGNFRIGFGK